MYKLVYFMVTASGLGFFLKRISYIYKKILFLEFCFMDVYDGIENKVLHIIWIEQKIIVEQKINTGCSCGKWWIG